MSDDETLRLLREVIENQQQAAKHQAEFSRLVDELRELLRDTNRLGDKP